MQRDSEDAKDKNDWFTFTQKEVPDGGSKTKYSHSACLSKY